jgi:hypothetical protein
LKLCRWTVQVLIGKIGELVLGIACECSTVDLLLVVIFLSG